MVAAEAAAAGVLPVSAAHSGAAEVSRALAATLPAEIRESSPFPLDSSAVRGIAARLNTWLRMDEPTRERARRALGGHGVRALGLGGGGAGRARCLRGVRLEELAPVPTELSPFGDGGSLPVCD